MLLNLYYFLKNRKGAVTSDYMVYIILIVIVLILVLIYFGTQFGKGEEMVKGLNIPSG